jgi:hypothetical protein
VRQFALAYTSDIGPSIFLHPLFTKYAITAIRSLRADDGSYTSIITYARPITRRAFHRFLSAYLAEESHSLTLADTHTAYEGGFIAGLSERTQLPEAVAFAACKLTFKRAPPSAVLVLTTTTTPTSKQASQKQHVPPKDNVHRFTAFFLQYKAAAPIDLEHVCFRILHIKAITTRPATDDGYMLSYITLHGKRSEASILNCIHEFNYWHFQTPIELHPSLPIGLRMQREAYAACRKQLMFSAPETMV